MEVQIDIFDKNSFCVRRLKASKHLFVIINSIPFGEQRLFFSPSKKDWSGLRIRIRQDYEKYKLKNKSGKTLELSFNEDGTIYPMILKA